MADIERSTATDPSGSQSTIDLTHTIPAGVNCLAVIVPFGYYPFNAHYGPTALVWDQGGVNESLTYIGRVSYNDGEWGAVELWLKWNPTPGSAKTLRSSWASGQPSQQQFVAFNLEGVDEAATGTPKVLSQVGTLTGAGDVTVTFNAANNAASVPGDIILGGWFDDQGVVSTLTVLNSPTVGSLWEDLGSGDSDGAAHGWEVTAADKTVGYNFDNAGNGTWQLGAWLFKGINGSPPHARAYGPQGYLRTLIGM